MQLEATDVLAKLLSASDAHAVAREFVDSLSEQFFTISSTYMELVRCTYVGCDAAGNYTGIHFFCC